MFGLFKKRAAKPRLERSQIVPRIKNTQFVPACKAAGVPDDQIPVTEPLVVDLIITYAFDLADAFMMATPSHIAELGMDLASLRDLALENVKRQIPNISIAQCGSVFRAITGNNLDAVTLLSRNFWSNQAKQMKGNLIASVPSRDVVLFRDSASDEGLREMNELAHQAFDAGGTHALTLELIQWCDDGWKAVNT